MYNLHEARITQLEFSVYTLPKVDEKLMRKKSESYNIAFIIFVSFLTKIGRCCHYWQIVLVQWMEHRCSYEAEIENT